MVNESLKRAPRTYNKKRIVFSIHDAGKTGYQWAEKKKKGYLIPFTKMDSKLIKG